MPQSLENPHKGKHRTRRNLAAKHSKFKPKRIKPVTVYKRSKYRLTNHDDLG